MSGIEGQLELMGVLVVLKELDAIVLVAFAELDAEPDMLKEGETMIDVGLRPWDDSVPVGYGTEDPDS